jgi:carbon monoxide dehydrogenase subunit G
VAFAYMAEVHNFESWDPGVQSVSAVDGNEPGLGAVFDVEVLNGKRTQVLRYKVVEWDPPKRFVLKAVTPSLQSFDIVRVAPDGDGSIVTYDARLDMIGVRRLVNPFLGPVFKRIGDRAAAGLRRVLTEAAPPA